MNVSVYEKGPKILVQGKGTSEFVRFILEPEILGQVELGYEEELHPEMFSPHLGIDESGKGDFFGPLVVAGAYVDPAIARAYREAGVQDSKAIGSDTRIRALARVVRETPGAACEVLVFEPAHYNALHAKFKNLNRLLAWGHGRVIEALLERKPACPRVLADQFADPALMRRGLSERGKRIELQTRTKAESDPAVAAASILARESFIDWMAAAGERTGKKFLRGASKEVKQLGADLVMESGPQILNHVAKTHFRTAHEIAPDAFAAPPERTAWIRR